MTLAISIQSCRPLYSRQSLSKNQCHDFLQQTKMFEFIKYGECEFIGWISQNTNTFGGRESKISKIVYFS